MRGSEENTDRHENAVFFLWPAKKFGSYVSQASTVKHKSQALCLAIENASDTFEWDSGLHVWRRNSASLLFKVFDGSQ